MSHHAHAVHDHGRVATETQTTTLHVGGLHYASEKAVVEQVLGRRSGVLHVEANPVAQTATVTFDPAKTSVEELAQWVEECGYHCAGRSVPGHICDPLAMAPCEDGFGCYPTADEQWACLPVGAAVVIGTLRPALCPPHSTAIDVTDASFCEPATDLCCAEICDLTAPTCVEPLQCRPIAKEGNVGLCLDPA